LALSSFLNACLFDCNILKSSIKSGIYATVQCLPAGQLNAQIYCWIELLYVQPSGMKKIYTLLTLFLTFPLAYCHAQSETNIWYFGYNAALDFNSGAPVNITGSLMSQFEGSASISDTAGNLLFYTDGITVWNKNNGIMANGTGLMGGSSSTQSSLIVPLPGSDSIYYLFTVSQQLAPGGLRYSIIDMSLQSGLGEVVDKNIFLLNTCTEKITAVCHTNGIDLWVITHGWNSNSILAYLLTSSGLNTAAVTSNVGTVASGSDQNTIGYLKGSFDGSKLAQAVYWDNYFEVFDFDRSTGIASNPVYLSSLPNATYGAYGVEFSPDGSKLYGTTVNWGVLYQWDLNAGSAIDIQNSREEIYNSSIDFDGALQMASDGKMYLAVYGSSWLGVINDPDSPATSCNFVSQGYSLANGATTGYGLPNIYPCFLSPNNLPVSAAGSSTTTLCQKFCVDFFDQSTNNPISWQWSFPGASPGSSTDQNPTNVCYQAPGTFDVTLITTNSFGSDTLLLTGYITVYPTPPLPTIAQNGFILTSSPAASYQWQFNSVDIPGATSQSYTIMQTGYYTVVITDANGCVASATVYVDITGIEEEVSDLNISVYPNPSDGNLVLSFSDYNNTSGASGQLQLDVVNALGQVVFSSEEKLHTLPFSKSIDLTHLSDGIYFLELKTTKAIAAKKFLISK